MLKKFIQSIFGTQATEKLALLKAYAKVHCNRYIRRLLNPKHTNKVGSYTEKLEADYGQTFFGYYDRTPFSHNNRYVLAHVAPSDNKTPAKNHSLSIGFFDLEKKDGFHEIGRTFTWCWQQGCRLQWFPQNENQLIFYNSIVDNHYGSVVHDIKNNKIVMSYRYPLYDIDRLGQWGLSLNFSRLQRLRPGYGYSYYSDTTQGEKSPSDDGIWRIDLNSGKANLIITLDQLATLKTDDSMKDAEHYVNHLASNPSGKRFLFFHLWTKNNKKYNRMITCNYEGNDVHILEDHGTVSHYAWENDNELIATVFMPGQGCRYKKYKDLSDAQNIVGENILNTDGHPSYSPMSDKIVTDTYPDKFREQSLLLFDPDNGLKLITKFFSPIQFIGEVRCDLHPRWDRTGKRVCVDSTHDGKRALYLIDIEDKS